MQKILIINGHPLKDSFNFGLAEEFKKGLSENQNKYEVKELILADLPLEKYLKFDGKSEVGTEIIESRELITWADHLVFVHPVWWGGVPALLKIFLDVVFASGFAFRFKEGSMIQEKLLTGKSASIITTSDTPPFVYKYLFGAPSVNQLKSRTLEFCGISPVRVHLVGPIHTVKPEKLEEYKKRIYQVGKNL